MSIYDLADCMKGGVQPNADPSIIQKFFNVSKSAAITLQVDYFLDSGLSTYQAAVSIRGAVIERISDVLEMSRVALSRGFVLPDNPFLTLESINSNRQIFTGLNLTVSQRDSLIDAAVKLSKIAAQYKDGTITFERKPAYQLSSYEVSVDGMSPQSGDALVDILGYQPDADFIKRKRALDSLAKLDFSKRRPYLLFTADFDGASLICWSRMPDATGYKISKRDVFAAVDFPSVYLENDKARQSTNELMADDRFFQALSFYDWLNHDDVLVYLDRSISPDTLYSFQVTGLQKRAPGTPFIFDVPTSSLFFSPAIIDQLRIAMGQEAEKFGRDVNTFSPYPALGKVIFGDAGYGWILAGVNAVASVRRNESPDQTRALGFIGSSLDEVMAAGRAGRLVVPQDLGKVVKSVEDSISAYGVSQTMVAVIEGLGMTEFIAGKDDPRGHSTQDLLDRSTSGLARILSVIDPVTATIDPKLLLASAASTGQKIGGRPSFVREVLGSSRAIPLDQIVGQETIDLTTYGGISSLVQILRSIYDFYPGALS